MKVHTFLFCVLLLAGCQPKEAKKSDTDFEGKIVYKMFEWETHGLDSAENTLAKTYLFKDSMICYFDEGSFLSILAGTVNEYQFFNPHTNLLYFKTNGNDTVRVTSGNKTFPGQMSLLDVVHELNTDTVLGYVCNKLIMKFKNETRTYLYSPKLATNAEWYKDTKAFNYDVTYKRMNAYYLSMHMEYARISYTLRATGIFPGKVPADIFPKTEDMLKVPFN